MNVTYKPETLVVTRDGQIDDEYYDAIYHKKRREALKAVPKQITKRIVDLLSNIEFTS